MNERTCSFGPGDCLAGVLTEPSPDRARPGAPGVLLWNVGFGQRIGPFRIFVDLARRLATEGFTVLRFDLSGLGDSGVRRDTVADLERAVLDLREAMAFLAAHQGIGSFTVVGFCSGVDAAHAVALEDSRVVGMVHLEGYVYPTTGHHLRRPLRLLERERWARYLSRRLAWLLRRNRWAPLEPERPEQVYLRDYPARERFVSELRRLCARRARLLFVYTGRDSRYNGRDQFFEMFGREFQGLLEVEYYQPADHSLFRVQDRARVIDRLSAFMAGAEDAGPGPSRSRARSF